MISKNDKVEHYNNTGYGVSATYTGATAKKANTKCARTIIS